MECRAVALKSGVVINDDFNVEIARATTKIARFTFARQSKLRAGIYTRRHLNA